MKGLKDLKNHEILKASLILRAFDTSNVDVAGQHEYGVSNWVHHMMRLGISVPSCASPERDSRAKNRGVCGAEELLGCDPKPLDLVDEAGEKGGGGGGISIPRGAGAW